jgi:hypothetical protein
MPAPPLPPQLQVLDDLLTQARDYCLAVMEAHEDGRRGRRPYLDRAKAKEAELAARQWCARHDTNPAVLDEVWDLLERFSTWKPSHGRNELDELAWKARQVIEELQNVAAEAKRKPNGLTLSDLPALRTLARRVLDLRRSAAPEEEIRNAVGLLRDSIASGPESLVSGPDGELVNWQARNNLSNGHSPFRVIFHDADESTRRLVERIYNDLNPQAVALGRHQEQVETLLEKFLGTESRHEYLEWSKLSRKFLVAIDGKGNVPIDTVLSAVYGSKSRNNLERLSKLKDRINNKLALENDNRAIVKRGETLSLCPI